MKIINNTYYSNETIGRIIDQIQMKYPNDTNYVGKVDYTTIEMANNIIVKIQIRYLKRYVEWRFDYE